VNELINILSTYSQISDFIQSTVWRDISNEIQVWIAQIHEQFEVAEEHKEFYKLQGSAEACRNFLALPQQILDALDLEKGIRDERAE
jgi:hypothetical protein